MQDRAQGARQGARRKTGRKAQDRAQGARQGARCKTGRKAQDRAQGARQGARRKTGRKVQDRAQGARQGARCQTGRKVQDRAQGARQGARCKTGRTRGLTRRKGCGRSTLGKPASWPTGLAPVPVPGSPGWPRSARPPAEPQRRCWTNRPHLRFHQICS